MDVQQGRHVNFVWLLLLLLLLCSIHRSVRTCVRLGGQVEMDVTWASRSVLESKEREKKEGCIPEPGPGLSQADLGEMDALTWNARSEFQVSSSQSIDRVWSFRTLVSDPISSSSPRKQGMSQQLLPCHKACIVPWVLAIHGTIFETRPNHAGRHLVASSARHVRLYVCIYVTCPSRKLVEKVR